MTTLAFTWSDLADLALAVFLFLVGAALAYALFRAGATLARTSSLIKGTERELLPVITKVGGTVDRVNEQLDKVDHMTDAAVDAVDNVDSAVRTVTSAVKRPVQKVTGFTTGMRYGASSLRVRHDWEEAVRVGKEEAARRERDLENELRGEVP
jgi:uncharacterized protein YoxC